MFETQILNIARHFFQTFSKPDSQAWVDAFREAELSFAEPFGATVAHATLITVNAMRVSRVRSFSYINPNCDGCRLRIPDEERNLISALRDVRNGRLGAAETNSLLLCEGGKPLIF